MSRGYYLSYNELKKTIYATYPKIEKKLKGNNSNFNRYLDENKIKEMCKLHGVRIYDVLDVADRLDLKIRAKNNINTFLNGTYVKVADREIIYRDFKEFLQTYIPPKKDKDYSHIIEEVVPITPQAIDNFDDQMRELIVSMYEMLRSPDHDKDSISILKNRIDGAKKIIELNKQDIELKRIKKELIERETILMSINKIGLILNSELKNLKQNTINQIRGLKPDDLLKVQVAIDNQVKSIFKKFESFSNDPNIF